MPLCKCSQNSHPIFQIFPGQIWKKFLNLQPIVSMILTNSSLQFSRMKLPFLHLLVSSLNFFWSCYCHNLYCINNFLCICYLGIPYFWELLFACSFQKIQIGFFFFGFFELVIGDFFRAFFLFFSLIIIFNLAFFVLILRDFENFNSDFFFFHLKLRLIENFAKMTFLWYYFFLFILNYFFNQSWC